MRLEKPASVAADEFKSAKWDEITAGRSFRQSDAPAISLLCQWYKIVELAQGELDEFGEQTAYSTESGDLKAFPQINTLKTASAEIRQLNKQLGIADGAGEADDEGQKRPGSVLELSIARREKRRAAAAG